MKPNFYMYYPFLKGRPLIYVFAVLEMLTCFFLFRTIVTIQYGGGEFLLQAILLAVIELSLMFLYIQTGRSVYRHIFFREAGLHIHNKPGKEIFIPWEELHYGYAVTNQAGSTKYMVLSQEPMNSQQLSNAYRSAVRSHRLFRDHAVVLPQCKEAGEMEILTGMISRHIQLSACQ